jgi:hypothetical protein
MVLRYCRPIARRQVLGHGRSEEVRVFCMRVIRIWPIAAQKSVKLGQAASVTAPPGNGRSTKRPCERFCLNSFAGNLASSLSFFPTTLRRSSLSSSAPPRPSGLPSNCTLASSELWAQVNRLTLTELAMVSSFL